MSLKQKIMISNILIICVPVALTVFFWFFYINSHQGMYINPADGNTSFNGMQYSLCLYENELSHLNFEKDFATDYEEPDIFLPEQMRRIQELSEMGFHVQIVTDDDILYSNMDSNDLKLLELHKEKNMDSMESIEYFKNNMIICNRVKQNDSIYVVTAVYDDARVNTGMQESLLPIYLVAPQVMVVFFLFAVVSIIATVFLMTRWLNHSVLKPLDILVSGTKEISAGNMDISLPYNQEDEFGTVIHEFENMCAKLKCSEKERELLEKKRRDFLVGVSHDLRSPMTSIRGYAEGLKDGIADSDEKRERYYNAILTRTIDMERLLSDLSKLVQIDSPEYNYQTVKVNLNEFLQQFIYEENVFAEQNAVTFTYSNHGEALEVSIDIPQMRRVFVNLLDNSVKYRTKSASKISLELRESDDKSMAEIYFGDDGPGVDESQLEQIFDSFYRADDSRTKPENGSGLGLSVVKSVVEGHGGYVKAYLKGGLGILIALPCCGRRNET